VEIVSPAATAIVKRLLILSEALSLTSTVKSKTPEPLTVPLINPLDESSISPGGSWPALIDQVMGGIPPVVSNCCEYGTPIEALERIGAVVTVNSGAVKRVNCFVATAEEPSVNCAVKLKEPALAGTPEIIPVEPSMDNPPGKAPAIIDHLNGATPPVAESGCEYAEPTEIGGNEGAVVMVSPEVTVSTNCLEELNDAESVTWAVKV